MREGKGNRQNSDPAVTERKVLQVMNLCLTDACCVFALERYNFRTAIAGRFSEPNCMRCPFCQHDETKVIDSRTSQDFSIRRRRQCLSCERRFTTYERVEESQVKVIKKDGSRVPFDRARIRAGVEKACYKRPIGSEHIDQLVADVEAALYEDGVREVPSMQIGEMVFNALRELDKVAFVRFASVYREFKDVNDFVEELQPILDDHLRSPAD